VRAINAQAVKHHLGPPPCDPRLHAPQRAHDQDPFGPLRLPLLYIPCCPKKRQQKSITRTFPVDACRSSISRPQAAAMGTRDTSRERSSPRGDDAASSSSFRSSHSCPSFTPPTSPRLHHRSDAQASPVPCRWRSRWARGITHVEAARNRWLSTTHTRHVGAKLSVKRDPRGAPREFSGSLACLRRHRRVLDLREDPTPPVGKDLSMTFPLSLSSNYLSRRRAYFNIQYAL
jgi:hypothetical protein